MKRIAPLAFGLLLATTALSSAVVGRTGGANSEAVNRSTLPCADPLRADSRRGVELDCRVLTVLDRIEAKRQVARALAEGRLTLLKAACRFRDLNMGRGEFETNLRRYPSGQTKEKRTCYSVIAWVDNELRRVDPKRADDLTTTLEAELHELERQGALVFPR
jgi:hypothetical protein